MLFNYLYFDPKDGSFPKIVMNDRVVNINTFANDRVLNHTINYFFKKYTKNPFFYFSGTHNIPQLDIFSKLKIHDNIIKNKNIDFFFFEPLTHYINGMQLAYQPHILKTNNSVYDIKNIRSYELDSISEWATNNNIKQLTVYCTDYGAELHYKDIYKNLNLKFLDVFAITIFNHEVDSRKHMAQKDVYIKETQFLSSNITKKIIAPAWRYDPSRHILISFLADKNLITNNNISFLYKLSNTDMIKNMWFNWKEFEFNHPEFSKSILSGNELLKQIVPLTLDVKNATVIENSSGSSKEGTNIISTHNVEDRYAESFLSVVMESRVTQPWPNISEKTINAITNRRPFVMLAAPNTLKMLREMGFKTFGDYWDESYDEIVPNNERIIKVCKLIESISKLSLDEMRAMYDDMALILLHNKAHMAKINKFYKKFI